MCKTKITALIGLTLLVSGCFHDDDYKSKDDGYTAPTPTPSYSYKITVLNLTNNQPLAPIVSVLHDDTYNAWTLGQPSSDALELLAESGDNSALIADPNLLSKSSGDAPLMPGNSYSTELTTTSTEVMLTVFSMLVNTNDAFTGLSQHDLSRYELGDVSTVNLSVYDSGTEANNESLASIPGPAAMGEGFNAVRDDLNLVTMHSGVVSNDDGLTNSALDQSHKFESIVARVTIERIK